MIDSPQRLEIMNLVAARAALLDNPESAKRLDPIAVLAMNRYGKIQLTSKLPESVIFFFV